MVCGVLDVSGMIDGDGSTLAFLSWTRSSLSACGTAHLDLGSANAVTTCFGRLQLRLNLPGAERHSACKRMSKSINRPAMPEVVSVCCAPAILASGMIGGQVLNARAFETGDPATDMREPSGNSTAGCLHSVRWPPHRLFVVFASACRRESGNWPNHFIP